jgi:hypothetical protein
MKLGRINRNKRTLEDAARHPPGFIFFGTIASQEFFNMACRQ